MDVHKENIDSPQPRRGVTFGASRSSRALQARTNKAGPARRAAKPAAREPSVFDIDDDAFADDFKDEMMAGPDEDDSEEETVHGADLLQASTATKRRMTAGARGTDRRLSAFPANKRLSIMAPAQRVNSAGETQSDPRMSLAARPRAVARPSPQRVRARPKDSPRKTAAPASLDLLTASTGSADAEEAGETTPGGTVVSPPAPEEASNEPLQVFTEAPSVAPEVSVQSVDLLTLIDEVPDIGVEWDRMMGGSLDSKEEIQMRLVQSGKIESWVAKSRQQRSVMVTKFTQMQKLVNAQWQKSDELELAAAQSQALMATNRVVEREGDRLKLKMDTLEQENVRLKAAVAESKKQVAAAAKKSTSQSQEHSAEKERLQSSTTALQAQLTQTTADAAAAATAADVAFKQMKSDLSKQIKGLESQVAQKDEEASQADSLTESMEQHLAKAEAASARLKEELASVQSELEDKLESSEKGTTEALEQVAELKKQLAEEEKAVVLGEQKMADAEAEFEDKLEAAEKMAESVKSAAETVQKELKQQKEERQELQAALKERDEVTMPAMERAVAEQKQRLEAAEKAAAGAAAELKEAQETIEASEEQTTVLKERLEDTTAIAQALRNEAKSVGAEKEALNAEISQLTQQCEVSTASAAQLQEKVDAMQGRQAETDAEKARVQDELEEANSLQQRFAHQVEVLSSQMTQTASIVEQIRSEKEAESAKAAAMAEQFEPLKAETKKLHAEKAELADENSRLAIRMKLLEEQASGSDLTQIGAATDSEFQRKQHASLNEEVAALREKCIAQASELANAHMQIAGGELQRRQMHNLICELKGNIRVFCRVRPLMEHDGDDSAPPIIRYPKSSVDDKEAIEVATESDAQIKQQFGFDKVFQQSSSQADIFREVSSLVQSAIDGYRCCIFAYGQTGSGKTHTMQGADGGGEERGIIPRSLEMIVAETERLKLQGWEYTLHASFLEIHNETIRDLLADPTAPKKELSIKHSTGGGTTVANAVEEQVGANASDISRLMARAQLQRSVGFTAMNAASSRSHAVFRLRLEGSREGEPSLSGVLNLIDLAGSERLNSSHATGERLKETQAINKSLSALGDVFSALVNNQGHVPFRNSKLTYLLQSSLGGNCKTLMLSNISPAVSSAGESLCSLRFASRVNKCELGRAKRQVKRPAPKEEGGGAAGDGGPSMMTRSRGGGGAAAEGAPARRGGGMANVRPSSGRPVTRRRVK